VPDPRVTIRLAGNWLPASHRITIPYWTPGYPMKYSPVSQRLTTLIYVILVSVDGLWAAWVWPPTGYEAWRGPR
jgi:hypothetical protein